LHPLRVGLPVVPGCRRLPRRDQGSRGADPPGQAAGLTMGAESARALMARPLALAAKGLYTTSPTPRVGCVVARGDRVLGEGWHERAGLPHAERLALDDARANGHDPRGATVYVTLEHCNHTGRTRPCVDALVEARVGRVVAAMADPNPVATGGAARLREAGIAVETGL